MNDNAPKSQLVTLPNSLLRALYALQKEPRGYEWGGGIDFEIIGGWPEVERVLAYFAEKGKVPEEVLTKYERDVEVLFHTHPRQSFVQPSTGDITAFLSSPAQAQLIIAGTEIALLDKRPDHAILVKRAGEVSLPVFYSPKELMPNIKKQLDKIGIDILIYPRGKTAPVFDLEVVRRLVSEEHVR